jgi:hypothetical protein
LLALAITICCCTEARRAKKRKQTLSVDSPDVEWFSTPALSDTNFDAEEGTSGTQAASGGPNPTNSFERLPTPPADEEIENVAGPSTSATASAGLTSSKKSSLVSGEGRGAAKYAYRTAPSHERSSPIDPTSISEFSSAPHSAFPPIPVSSTSTQQLSGETRNCSATSEGPPSSKQKSNRKMKREKSKEATSSVAPMSPATTNTPTTPTTPTTVEDDDMRSEQVAIAQPGGQQSGPNEDIDSTREIVNAEPIVDDPLDMRAGLVANGVRFCHEKITHINNLALPVAVYSSLRN